MCSNFLSNTPDIASKNIFFSSRRRAGFKDSFNIW
jgi:hypothetical protein